MGDGPGNREGAGKRILTFTSKKWPQAKDCLISFQVEGKRVAILAFADSNPKCRVGNSRRVLHRAWVRSYGQYLVEFHTKYASLFILREVCLQLWGNQCRWLANHLILLIIVYKIKKNICILQYLKCSSQLSQAIGWLKSLILTVRFQPLLCSCFIYS